MTTNFKRPALAAGPVLAGARCGTTAASWPRQWNAPRHAGACFKDGGRVPVSAQNREYLKALREAELATWQTFGRTRPAPKRPARHEPAAGGDNRGDGRYVLLAVLCFLTLAYEWWSLWMAADSWGDLVQLLRQLLG